MKTARILAILVLALGMASVSLAAEDSWTRKADMPTPRTHLSTSVVDGKIYAIGGGASVSIGSYSGAETFSTVENTTRGRTSEHFKTAEFPMKACWKEDAQVVAGKPQKETVIETVHNFSIFYK